MQNHSGGTCNWLHTGGARLIEVAATAGGTVCSENKGADQLRSYCETDLRHCFCK